MQKKLIVGLGNPGKNYLNTRHNIGFRVLDKIQSELNVSASKSKFNGAYFTGEFLDFQLYCLKPLTFMNRSGECVAEFLRYFEMEPEHMIVIHDELDIEFGKLRVKFGGGSAGHKGLDSIIFLTHEDKFTRIRMGIGKPERRGVTQDYVLSNFSGEEGKELDKFLGSGVEAVFSLLRNGLSRTMNEFNTSKDT